MARLSKTERCNREWYEKNRNNKLKYQKDYYKDNAEARREYQRNYYNLKKSATTEITMVLDGDANIISINTKKLK